MLEFRLACTIRIDRSDRMEPTSFMDYRSCFSEQRFLSHGGQQYPLSITIHVSSIHPTASWNDIASYQLSIHYQHLPHEADCIPRFAFDVVQIRLWRDGFRPRKYGRFP
jgi:hypothetical protein